MSCCGSLFVNLGGGGGSIADGVLQTPTALTSSLQIVKDNLGNSSLFKLATTQASFAVPGASEVIIKAEATLTDYTAIFFGTDPKIFSKQGGALFLNIANGLLFENYYSAQGGVNTSGLYVGSGTVTQNGALTVKGAGSNILSLRNSSNVEKVSINNNAVTSWVNNDTVTLFPGGGGNIPYIGTESANSFGIITSNAYQLFINTAGVLQFKGQTIDFAALVQTNTPPTLSAKDATATNLSPFSAEDFTSANLSAGTLNTARPMQFGDKGTVTTGNDLGLDAQIAVEHNGNVYYIPCSTVLLT